jgi:hypothetical protein
MTCLLDRITGWEHSLHPRDSNHVTALADAVVKTGSSDKSEWANTLSLSLFGATGKCRMR